MSGMSLYTSSSAAEYLGVCQSLVCRYCRLGTLPAEKIGRDWLISRENLDKFKATPRPRGNPQWIGGRKS